LKAAGQTAPLPAAAETQPGMPPDIVSAITFAAIVGFPRPLSYGPPIDGTFPVDILNEQLSR
jgi:hypothetical protein